MSDSIRHRQGVQCFGVVKISWDKKVPSRIQKPLEGMEGLTTYFNSAPSRQMLFSQTSGSRFQRFLAVYLYSSSVSEGGV